jgi:methionyl-tRNA formyltransferase
MRYLIISDNVDLMERCYRILTEKQIVSHFDFYSTTPLQSSIISSIDTINLREEEAIEGIILKYKIVLSIHCKTIFPVNLVNSVKCFNLHPGYNPINRGWYPQVFAIIHDFEIGATLHEIDEQLDNGKIIDRRLVKKDISDTSKSLYDRVLLAEIDIFNDNIENLIKLEYQCNEPEGEGNIFYKSDFKELCELKLNETGTFLSFYNKLRALSFDGYKNAYFYDPTNSIKIYIKIEIEK